LQPRPCVGRLSFKNTTAQREKVRAVTDMIKSITELHIERAREYMALARNKYDSAVRPIYGIRRRGVAPIHIGSCVLLSLRDTRFLVTATHVIAHAKEIRLHVAGAKELIPLSFDASLTTTPDLYDFSVCVPSQVMQMELGDVMYIPEREIYETVPLGRNRLRMVMGYPTSKNKKGIDNPRKAYRRTLWTYINMSFAVEDTAAASILGAPTEDHLLNEFDHKNSLDLDGIGVHSITPHGASGGAMFDLGKMDVETLAKPAQCEAKLAGILTEYRPRNKVIVATSMKPMLDGCRSLLSKA
jgi:hypothetical protein